MSGYDGSGESVSFAPPNLGIQAESAQHLGEADRCYAAEGTRAVLAKS
jgi:hypothetical protein